MSDFAPLISIIVPVYNGAKYMREAIDSALAQSYSNKEIIVVNDGSKDSTAEIAASYGEAIRYLEQENGGVSAALNAGIEAMRGEYFSWLSHDDAYTQDKLARQVTVLGQIADRRTILYSGYSLMGPSGEFIATFDPAAHGEKLNIPLYPLVRGLLHGCSMLIHRSLFDEFGRFDTTLRSTQDYDLWFRMLRRTPICYVGGSLVKSRVHPEQGTHTLPNHLAECNALWKRFADVTLEEATAVSGGRYSYLVGLAKFLEGNTPFKEAQERVAALAEETIEAVKVSVVIPFFNRIEWTIEAIQSALSQTHKNVEVIAIDDGSTDDVSVISSITDPRFQYERIEKGGTGPARNRGVRQATGSYVAFLDSDDLFMPEKVRTQLVFMELGQFRFSHTSYQQFHVDGRPGDMMPSGKLAGSVFRQLVVSCPIASPTVMIRRELALAHPFPSHTIYGEDVITWLGIAETTTLGGIDEPLSLVRVSNESTARHRVKLSQGIMAIASYVLARHGEKYASEVGTLLRALASHYPASGERKPVAMGAPVRRRTGIVAAVRRVRRYFRRRAISSEIADLRPHEVHDTLSEQQFRRLEELRQELKLLAAN